MQKRYPINTEHNMKSMGRAAVAQYTNRLTRNGQTRVQIREAHSFDITKKSSLLINNNEECTSISRKVSGFLKIFVLPTI